MHTSRLSLSPLTPDDIDLSIKLWTDPKVAHFNGGVATEAELRREMPLTTRRGASGTIGIWCVTDRDSGAKIGSTYLLPLPTTQPDVDYASLEPGTRPAGDIELGYFLTPSAWGCGLATEISRRMLRFAFETAGLDDVVAAVHADNVASKRVLAKAGFSYEGIVPCWGESYPLYRLSSEDWSAQQAPVSR